MPYTQLLYHLLWSTQNRQPLLTARVELVVYGFLRTKAMGLGAVVFALNGTADHVHMVVSIPSSIAVATFVEQIKTTAAAKLNQTGLLPEPFSWQTEYSACTFDAQRLHNYIAYVERQKEHHTRGTTIPFLERLIEDKLSASWEDASSYYDEDPAWRHELETMEPGSDAVL